MEELEKQYVYDIEISWEDMLTKELPLELTNVSGGTVTFDDAMLAQYKKKAQLNIDNTRIAEEAQKAMLIKMEKEKLVSVRVQLHLDREAQKGGWDSMQSARAAAGIPLDGTETDIELSMHNDAISLARWYLKVWANVFETQGAIEKGLIAEPTLQELISQLPKRV